MQRDLKVGLSLGVLVLGVVGALLFRREDVSQAHKPTLRTARKIDERIAERPRTPYMTGDVEFDQDETSKPKADVGHQDGRPSHSIPPNWLDDDQDPFQVARTPQGNQAEAGAIRTQPRNARTHQSSEASNSVAQTHVIQSGDSLSTIAAHYLGSQGRFQELYEANRDVLTDPNRLPVGATIVIPPSTSPRTAARGRASSAASAAGKPLVAQSERARGTITDVSAVEPIAPQSEPVRIDSEIEPVKTADQADPVRLDSVPAAPAPVVPQTRETRKLFAPSRLPFSNNRGLPASPARKPLDPEGESFSSLQDGAVAGQSRHYQVRKGDSLERISQKVYGNSKRAADIFAANRAQLASPDAVREGQELVLPN